jgi:hypothetical protein
MAKYVVTGTDKFLHRFAHFSAVAMHQPVVVTKNGRPRNILISLDEYERLRKRDRQAFYAADTPKHFLIDVESLALGKA